MFAGIFDDNRATARVLVLGVVGLLVVGAVVLLLFGGVFSDGDESETPDVEGDTDPAANESEVVHDPEAAFDVSHDEPIVGETVTLNASESTVHEDAEIVAYDWDIGGDERSDAVVEQSFDTAGDHEVALTVETDAGAIDTTTQTISVEPVPDTASASFAVYEQDNSSENTYNSGEIVLRDDSDEVITRRALSLADWHEFEDLDYGEHYSVTVETDEWHDERVEFEAGEVEREEIVVGYEFQSADSFRYVSSNNYNGPETYVWLELRGEYASNGNALYYAHQLQSDGDIGREVMYYTEGGYGGMTWGLTESGGLNEGERVGIGYADAPYNDPVFKGMDAYDNDEREFIGRTEVDGMDDRFVGEWTDGKELDLYHVDVSSQYSEGHGTAYDEVRAYVDSATGYVVRTEADVARYPDWDETDADIIFEFKDHEEAVEVEIDPDDLEIEEPF